MTSAVADYLAKARKCLEDAQALLGFMPPLNARFAHIAAREAYLAAFHAAEAYLHAKTGKGAKTHSGLRTEFARLARDEPRIDRALVSFLGTSYELKATADYEVAATVTISLHTATEATTMARRFVDTLSTVITDDWPDKV